MKKIILLLALCLLVGCDLPKKESSTPTPTMTPTEVPTEKPTETPAPTEDPYAGMKEEEKTIRQYIDSEFTKTDITSITLNPDIGTEIESDYIALVYLTWNVKNSEETSKEMLELYSSELSTIVSTDAPNVQEFAIFWTIPYLNKTAKYSYERKGNGMVKSDEVWS